MKKRNIKIGFALLATLILSTSGCAEANSPSASPSAQVAISKNCEVLNDFTTNYYYSDEWNTYDAWAYDEAELFLKLDVGDVPSFMAITSLRSGDYANWFMSPPEYGSVYVYDLETPLNYEPAGGADWDLIVDDGSYEVPDMWTKDMWNLYLDDVTAVCPTADTQFWIDNFWSGSE